MTLVELLTAVGDLIADYPIIAAVISLTAVFGALRQLISALRSSSSSYGGQADDFDFHPAEGDFVDADPHSYYGEQGDYWKES